MIEKAEDAKEPREAEDIPAENFQSTEVKAIENAEEPDCAAQVATEELNETAEIDVA